MRFLTSLPRAAGVAALGATTGLVLPRRLAAPAEPHEAAQPPKGGAKASELRSAMDPHLWLEEIEGEAALEWCKEQNSRAVGIVGDPHASDTYRKILAIADSKDKIPHVGRIGGRTGDEEVLRDGSLRKASLAHTPPIRGRRRSTTTSGRTPTTFAACGGARRWPRTARMSPRGRRWAHHPVSGPPARGQTEHACGSGGARQQRPRTRTCPQPPRQVLSLDALNGVEARAEGEEWVWGGYDLLDEGGGRSLWDRALLFLSPV